MLNEIKKQWTDLLLSELSKMAGEKNLDASAATLIPAIPPKPELGDIAFPLFPYAKVFHMAPQVLSAELASRVNQIADRPAGIVIFAGPYLNIKIDMDALASSLAKEIEVQGSSYGNTNLYSGRRIMIEFSCPNTNKPLHLGHMRNDSIGNAVSRIAAANGAEVKKVNLINNRGVHICKSMLAYKRFGHGETPESSGIKGDHLVGDYYVRFATWEKEEEAKPEAEREKPTPGEQAQAMLRAWEAGDPEVLGLWRTMNKWTLDGLAETYRATGISFDKYYYESDTYLLGKDKILKGLSDGIFYREPDGSVWVDLAPIGLDKKVLLRSDGTALYLTQDIGTAIARHEDWPFDSLIYVVGNEQQYHFKVLFYVLSKLGYAWADELHHLSYGMVNLPEGKMKSREGTVVDADDLLAELTRMAKDEIIEKEREEQVGDVDATSAAIALGALNYFLLQVSPLKDMTFNPKESLSFSGNTGPYLQYMGARISSMLSKFDAASYKDVPFDASVLKGEEEREIIKTLDAFPETVRKAGEDLDPSVITAYLYELSRLFSKWYHDNRILNAETPALIVARVRLSAMVLQVLRNAFDLVGIPFLETM